MPPIAVVINRAAGSARGIRKSDVSAMLSGVRSSVRFVSHGSQVVAAAKRAMADGAQTVVAGGGDGTVNAVASALVGTEVGLGVIPLGTLNHFARALNLPLDHQCAMRIILANHRIKIDTGEVNGKLFLNNSSIGLYPDIVVEREFEQAHFGRAKWLAFASAVLQSMRRYPFLDVKLTVNGHDLARHTPFVFIGNNEYALAGLDPYARSTLQGGVLRLCALQAGGRLDVLRFAFRAIVGRLGKERNVDIVDSTAVVVETKRSHIRVATDGEVTMMETPLRYRIRARALHVIVPARTRVAPARAQA